jgi:hypothetical protein
VIGSKAERVAKKGRSFFCRFKQRERLGGPETQESRDPSGCVKSTFLKEQLSRWD